MWLCRRRMMSLIPIQLLCWIRTNQNCSKPRVTMNCNPLPGSFHQCHTHLCLVGFKKLLLCIGYRLGRFHIFTFSMLTICFFLNNLLRTISFNRAFYFSKYKSISCNQTSFTYFLYWKQIRSIKNIYLKTCDYVIIFSIFIAQMIAQSLWSPIAARVVDVRFHDDDYYILLIIMKFQLPWMSDNQPYSNYLRAIFLSYTHTLIG